MTKEDTYLAINDANNAICANVYKAFVKTYRKNPKNLNYRPFALAYATCLGHALDEKSVVNHAPTPTVLNNAVENTEPYASPVTIDPQILTKLETFDRENPTTISHILSKLESINHMRGKEVLPDLSTLADDHTNEIVESDTQSSFETKYKAALTLCSQYSSKRKQELCMIAANCPYAFRKCQDLPSSELQRCLESDRRYRRFLERIEQIE